MWTVVSLLREIESSKYLLLSLIKRESQYESIVMEPNTEILSRLKFLSHIQKGDKISSRNMTLQMDCWATRVTRTWITPDNRANTLKLIREIVTRSFEILMTKVGSKKEGDLVECRDIVSDLNKAKSGLLNLKTTYDADIKFGCDLDILLRQISAKLAEIQKDTPGLCEIDPLQTHLDLDLSGTEKKIESTLS